MKRLLIPALILALTCCAQAHYKPSGDVWFPPADDAQAEVIKAIGNADTSLHLAMFDFNDADIAQALIEAHSGGKDVEVLLDASQFKTDAHEPAIVSALTAAGIDVRKYTGPHFGYLHDKFLVVDGSAVLTGSFNYTHHAETANAENLLAVTKLKTVAKYSAEFSKLWAKGKAI